MLEVLMVGTGAIFKAHVEGLKALGDRVHIAAVSSRRLNKVQEIIEKYGLDAKAYDDHRQALAAQHYDLAVILTPPATHKEITIDCLNAGINVLLEKPMASALDECDAILEASKRNGKFVSVVAQTRFMNHVNHVHALLEQGVCGKLNYSQVNSYWFRGKNYYDLEWKGSWEKDGGGVATAQAIHHLDLLLWMTGMPTEVTATIGNIAHDNSEEEDIALAILKYANGSMAQVNCCLMTHGQRQELCFHGSEAALHIPFSIEADMQRENGFPLPNKQKKAEIQSMYDALPSLKWEAHTGQIEDVVAAIEQGREPLVTGVDGRNAMELIAAIYQSGVEKRTVTLPLDADSDFYTRAGLVARMPRFYQKTGFLREFGNNDIRLAGEDM